MVSTVTPRTTLLVAFLGGATAIASVGCEAGEVGSHLRSFTSTVSLSLEQAVFIIAPVSIEVVRSRRTDILITVDAVVTASTATVARQVAEALAIEISRPDSNAVIINLPAPTNGTLAGGMHVEVPGDIDVDVRSNNVAVVRGVERRVQAVASNGVEVEGARGSVTVVVNSGPAIVESLLEGGATVDVTVGSGDLLLRLPSRMSADVNATIGDKGEVLIEHPALPAPLGIGKTRYRATVNGGLSLVRALTTVGRIVIRPRSGT